MLRLTLVCLIALAVQIFALPENIENLERDLAALPEAYQYIANEFHAKRAVGSERDTNAYCCKKWQYINNDEVHTKVQTVSVVQSHIVVIGYQDCEGNINPTRPPMPIPSTTRRGFTIIPPSGGSGSTQNGCTWTPVNTTQTYMTTQYSIITYLVPNSHTYCAPEDYICCPTYVMLNGNCIHESSVASLEFLLQLGLIGGGSGVGK